MASSDPIYKGYRTQRSNSISSDSSVNSFTSAISRFPPPTNPLAADLKQVNKQDLLVPNLDGEKIDKSAKSKIDAARYFKAPTLNVGMARAGQPKESGLPRPSTKPSCKEVPSSKSAKKTLDVPLPIVRPAPVSSTKPFTGYLSEAELARHWGVELPPADAEPKPASAVEKAVNRFPAKSKIAVKDTSVGMVHSNYAPPGGKSALPVPKTSPKVSSATIKDVPLKAKNANVKVASPGKTTPLPAFKGNSKTANDDLLQAPNQHKENTPRAAPGARPQSKIPAPSANDILKNFSTPAPRQSLGAEPSAKMPAKLSKTTMAPEVITKPTKKQLSIPAQLKQAMAESVDAKPAAGPLTKGSAIPSLVPKKDGANAEAAEAIDIKKVAAIDAKAPASKTSSAPRPTQPAKSPLLKTKSYNGTFTPQPTKSATKPFDPKAFSGQKWGNDLAAHDIKLENEEGYAKEYATHAASHASKVPAVTEAAVRHQVAVATGKGVYGAGDISIADHPEEGMRTPSKKSMHDQSQCVPDIGSIIPTNYEDIPEYTGSDSESNTSHNSAGYLDYDEDLLYGAKLNARGPLRTDSMGHLHIDITGDWVNLHAGMDDEDVKAAKQVRRTSGYFSLSRRTSGVPVEAAEKGPKIKGLMEAKNGSSGKADPRKRKGFTRHLKNWWRGSNRLPKVDDEEEGETKYEQKQEKKKEKKEKRNGVKMVIADKKKEATLSPEEAENLMRNAGQISGGINVFPTRNATPGHTTQEEQELYKTLKVQDSRRKLLYEARARGDPDVVNLMGDENPMARFPLSNPADPWMKVRSKEKVTGRMEWEDEDRKGEDEEYEKNGPRVVGMNVEGKLWEATEEEKMI